MSRILLRFSLFVILSLLLHLGVFFYFATIEKETATPEITPAPFFVNLREAEQKPRELDVPLRQQTTPRTQPARKLAESDQVAEREAAPKGNEWRDTAPVPTTQTPPITTVIVTPPVSEKGIQPPLTPKALLLSTKKAAQSVADLDPERKMLRDVEEGNVLLLDTEKDILGSFYKRFRESVMEVWDYPKDAIARGEAGICLYRIEINVAGVLIGEPQLLKSSGSERLDAEAKRAVTRAAPRFGSLPDVYRYETLTIFAYFDYRLGNQLDINEVYYYR